MHYMCSKCPNIRVSLQIRHFETSSRRALSASFQLSAFSQVFTTHFTCFSSTKVQILASSRFSTFQQSAFSQTQGLWQQTAPSGRS